IARSIQDPTTSFTVRSRVVDRVANGSAGATFCGRQPAEASSPALRAPSPPSDGGEGWGEEVPIKLTDRKSRTRARRRTTGAFHFLDEFENEHEHPSEW